MCSCYYLNRDQDQQSAMSEFTEEKKAKALLVINKILEEDKDKFHVYHDIYHALLDSCNCRIPENQILPGREDLLHFLHQKMVDHKVHGRTHERLVEVVESLIAVDTIPTESSLFRVLNNPKDYAEAIRVRHLFGAETLESLQIPFPPSSSKKRSHMGKTEKEKNKKKKSTRNL
jgi:hypothetical protein